MRHKALLILASAAALSFSSGTVFADIYQYTDDSGVIHFSDTGYAKGKKYRKIKTEPRKEQAAKSARPSRGRASSPAMTIPAGYFDIINAACDRHGVDPALVHAIVKVESDFNPYAMSRKGAMGLMQLMPQTALDMNVRNTFNPGENIDGGVKYLRYLIDRYEGNLPLALAAYNSGESAVKKWGTIPPFPETKNYVEKVLKLYNGSGSVITPSYTIYMGYGEDGSIVLTDNPGKNKSLKRKTGKDL